MVAATNPRPPSKNPKALPCFVVPPPSSHPSHEILSPYDAPDLSFSSTMAANANSQLFRAKRPLKGLSTCHVIPNVKSRKTSIDYGSR